MKNFLLLFAALLCLSAVSRADGWDTTLIRARFDGTSVTLNWMPAVNSDAVFSVYRSDVIITDDSQWNLLTPITTTAYNTGIYADAVPQTYTVYYYRVKNSTGQVFSDTISSSLYQDAITGYDGFDSKVVLAWDKSADATLQYYNVYRSTDPALLSAIVVGQGPDNKMIDESAANQISYYYCVQPVSVFKGSFTQSVTVTPFAPPFAPVAVDPTPLFAVSGTAVTMYFGTTMTRGSYDVAGYNIYRSPTFVSLSDLKATTLTGYYNDTGLAPGQRYNYQIRTVDINSNVSQPLSFSALIPGLPSMPANLKASADSASATITWDPNPSDEGVTSYLVFRDALSYGTSPNNSFIDSAVSLGASYNYTVQAQNITGAGPVSAPVAAFIKPAAPLNVAVARSVSPGALSLSWDPLNALENATGYNIYRALSPLSFDYSSPTLTTFTPYEDTAVTAGQAYFYTVSGYSTIEGARSLTVSAIPVTTTVNVQNLTATAYNSYALLRWDNEGPAYDVTGYKIYESTDPSPVLFNYITYITTTAGAVTSLNVTGLDILNKAYYLKVSAVNSYGEGNTPNASYIDITMTAGTAPAAPSNVTATAAAGDGTISLSWDNAPAGSNVTSFNVYRSTYPGAYDFNSPAAIVTHSFYNDATYTAALGVNYYYKVNAEANSLTGPASTEANAAAFLRPYPVNSPAGSFVNGNILLIWAAPSQSGTFDNSPKTYRIYRSTVAAFSDTPYVNSLTAEQYLDTDINTLLASTYNYKIKNFDANGYEDTGSGTVSISIPLIQPPPKTLVALAGDKRVTLIWYMVTPQYYNIYRRLSTDPAYGPPVAYNVQFSLKDYIDLNLQNGLTYFYMIKAVNLDGEGPASMEVSATPYTAVTLPLGAAVTAGTPVKKSVPLSWPAAIPGSPFTLSGYDVLRSSDGGGNYTLITFTTQTFFVDNTTSWNTIYYYLVETLDSGGNTDGVYSPAKVVIPLPDNKIRVYRNLMNLSLGDTLKLHYVLVQSGKIKLRIYTLSGAFVTELVDADITGNIDSQNPYESDDFYWDGKNKAGQKVASGVYILSLETPHSRVIEKVAVVK